MSTMRTTAALAESKQTAKPNNLNTYFQPSFERENGNFSVIEHTYKKGTTQEALIGLRDAPQTAKDFYELAVAIDNGTLALREDSYFFSGLQDDTPQETFLFNILFDAAQADYQPARAFLAQLIADPAYEIFTPAIMQLFNQQGYQLIKNQSGQAALELWSKRKAPQSIAELRQLAQDLETQGPVGTDYFLVDPSVSEFMAAKLRKLAKNLQARGAHWIEENLVELRKFARAGRIEEARKLTQAILDTGVEVYTQKAHLDRIAAITQDLLHLAIDLKPTDSTDKPTVLKTTGQHKQALKQPQLAAGITKGLLSSNASTLHSNSSSRLSREGAAQQTTPLTDELDPQLGVPAPVATFS